MDTPDSLDLAEQRLSILEEVDRVRSALNELRHLTALGVVLNRASSHVPKRILHLLSV
jgi:hypothetical protein